MKISNSKKQLAKIIHENGGWRDGANFSAQDKNASVTFFVDAPWRCGTTWECDNFEAVDGFCVTEMSLKHWHQTILSRDEYFHLYPANDAGGWIKWGGAGDVPHNEFVLVDTRHRAGHIEIANRICDMWWDARGIGNDIIAYRLHKPEAAPATQEPKPVPAPEAKPTIEQLATDYRNAKGYADRKQKEVDAAKVDAETKLAELVAAGKALGLVLSVAAPEPELVITDWRGLVTRSSYLGGRLDYMIGRIGVVERIDKRDDSRPIKLSSSYIRGDHEAWPNKWRFIRRP